MPRHKSQRLLRPLPYGLVVQIRAHPEPVRTVLEKVHFNGHSSLDARLVEEQRILHWHQTVVRAVNDEYRRGISRDVLLG
jgi:hypothetical protein